ncbi:hypothetical protein KC19_VG266500 [Ceratodon purpureus]|uniref:Uncharacterized protein n=1 Tax=Ceratodon purpureus TaxID=3225 RepID=A0A8T0HVF5_CERPU|nr:hypothetical protein KC19_VG266500 [Ceratodon purpureus]
MKRVYGEISHGGPCDVVGVRAWLRRVQLYAEVNWETELPSYSAITHLIDDDFVFDWTPLCSRQYEAVAAVTAVTGIVHVDNFVVSVLLGRDYVEASPMNSI